MVREGSGKGGEEKGREKWSRKGKGKEEGKEGWRGRGEELQHQWAILSS